MEFFGPFRQICITFGANLASNFNKMTQKHQFLMVLFVTNLVSTLASKHQKTPYIMPDHHLFNAYKLQINANLVGL